MQILSDNGSGSGHSKAFLDSMGRNSASSRSAYQIALSRFDKFLNNSKGLNIETVVQALQTQKKQLNVYELLDQFISFIMKEQSNLSTKSIKLYVAAIRSYLQYCDIDIVSHKFKHRVKMPRDHREDEQPLDIEDIRNLLHKCHNKRLKAFLLVLASSGLRANEACTLRIQDVDFTTSPTKIHVRKEFNKTRTARDVYISDEATQYLRELIESYYYPKTDSIPSDKHLIFAKYKEEVLSRSIYFRLVTEFQKLLQRTGMNQRKDNSRRRKITMHSFRRTVFSIINDQAGSEYANWFLGHEHSVYWVRKEIERRKIYATKCMPYLTILDYSSLDTRSKNLELKMQEKDKAIQRLTKQMKILEEHQKIQSEILENLTPEVLERIGRS